MSPPGTAGSYQLPDLLSHFQDYHELSINSHCYAASLASGKWVRDEEHSDSPSVLLASDRLASMKLGLLGACSFPSCDLTQLVLMMDVWTLIILDTQLLLRSDFPTMSRWDFVDENSHFGYIELLRTHPVLQRLVPRLSRLKDSTSDFWQQRFASSIAAFRRSQQKAIDYRLEGPALAQLGIDEYIDFRRDFSGMPIILDLIEPVGGLKFDIPIYDEDLCTLRRLVGEIIVLSWDVFSYNIDQFTDNKLNIVSLLQSEREVALVHSIKDAGDLILQRLSSFKSLEKSLLSSVGELPQAPASKTSAASLKSWFSFDLFSETQKLNNPRSSITEFQAHDIALYVRSLKDCMIGFLNWTYETDMFFGTKGESVKSFGWVFLLPPQHTSGTGA
ncbi:hypothetical protein J3R30DRAFT_110451 [Lentinula aciculospora]|uniref:Terpenoid synthase n=1 Tax=Lentinula aciculospora TaxID=153920 RepID=A0A9W9AW58_9AGAR|nr:hypothetical protein J3R30DRAFT_110451 [Lentinula aciculospora]